MNQFFGSSGDSPPSTFVQEKSNFRQFSSPRNEFQGNTFVEEDRNQNFGHREIKNSQKMHDSGELMRRYVQQFFADPKKSDALYINGYSRSFVSCRLSDKTFISLTPKDNLNWEIEQAKTIPKWAQGHYNSFVHVLLGNSIMFSSLLYPRIMKFCPPLLMFASSNLYSSLDEAFAAFARESSPGSSPNYSDFDLAIISNHGTIVRAQSLESALDYAWNFERAIGLQIKMTSTFEENIVEMSD
jgi:hypothetical protein